MITDAPTVIGNNSGFKDIEHLRAEVDLAAAREELAHIKARYTIVHMSRATARAELIDAQAEIARLQAALSLACARLQQELDVRLDCCCAKDSDGRPIRDDIDSMVVEDVAALEAVIAEAKAALGGGDNRVGEVVKAARTVVGAPAGPLPSELAEAIKVLDAKLADLDVGPERTE